MDTKRHVHGSISFFLTLDIDFWHFLCTSSIKKNLFCPFRLDRNLHTFNLDLPLNVGGFYFLAFTQPSSKFPWMPLNLRFFFSLLSLSQSLVFHS
jgi:hypothetical protein